MTNKLLRFFYSWGLFGISLMIVIAYIAYSAIPQKSTEVNIWTNILFNTLNLLAAFYMARQVSLWGWQTDNALNQKKLAKTAIRHNRASLTSIVKLIKITKEKIELVQDDLTKQYLREIKNHLEMIYNSLKNSEADFNEIVNEELKEQNILEIEISELLEDIETKSIQLKEQEEASDNDKKLIDNLKREIKKKESELSLKVSTLPLGSNTLLPMTSIDLTDSSTSIFWESLLEEKKPKMNLKFKK